MPNLQSYYLGEGGEYVPNFRWDLARQAKHNARFRSISMPFDQFEGRPDERIVIKQDESGGRAVQLIQVNRYKERRKCYEVVADEDIKLFDSRIEAEQSYNKHLEEGAA